MTLLIALMLLHLIVPDPVWWQYVGIFALWLAHLTVHA